MRVPAGAAKQWCWTTGIMLHFLRIVQAEDGTAAFSEV
jgi:hypothetical protein